MLRRLSALMLALCLTAVACTTSDVSRSTDVPASTEPTSSATSTTTTTTMAPATTEAIASTTTATEPDVTPPALTVTQPEDGDTVSRQTIQFHGLAEPLSTIAADDGDQIAADEAGIWELPVTLAWGDNEIQVSARDEAGNETLATVSVRYTPPMPCDFHVIHPEHQSDFPVGTTDWCGGWGYVTSVDVGGAEIGFDLAVIRLTVPGDESQGWTIDNTNPGIRTLPVTANVEVRACPPDSGETVPGSTCGEPWVGNSWGFSLWTLTDLKEFVDAGHDFWLVLIDPPNGEVVWVEQWWSP